VAESAVVATFCTRARAVRPRREHSGPREIALRGAKSRFTCERHGVIDIDTVRAREDRMLGARVVEETPLAGVTSGSALLRIGATLIAVHDDAFRVSRIALPTLAVTPFVLAGDGAPLAKIRKPDFECALLGAAGEIHVLGSGSTPNRCTLARIDPHTSRVSFAERPGLYRCVTDALALATRPNIEGALADGERLRLFHRGVAAQRSAIVDLPLAVLDGAAAVSLAAQWFELGDLDGVRLGFTDAAATARRTLFVAAAEDTEDAVADGAVTGSVIGVIEVSAVSGAIGAIGASSSTLARWTRLVGADGTPWRYKVEGIAIDEDLRGGWILTDADDPAISTVLGRIELAGFEV
jgi:hypothetical protein